MIMDWHKVALGDVVTLQLSSVDKKSKASERAVRLCNYMDVYANNFIRRDMDFMAATATDREITNCSRSWGMSSLPKTPKNMMTSEFRH